MNCGAAWPSFKANGKLGLYEKKMVDGMVRPGLRRRFLPGELFKQLQGFEGYGFPESHAASFALLVYISSWLKHYYPDVFVPHCSIASPWAFTSPRKLYGMHRTTM
jgi:error-prone DNA polymerase